MTRRLTALALALVLALSLTGCWEAEPEPDNFWNDDLSSPSEEEPQREPGADLRLHPALSLGPDL